MEGYSEEDALLQARLSLFETQKHCKHAQDWILVVREWIALAECIRRGNYGTIRAAQEEAHDVQSGG